MSEGKIEPAQFCAEMILMVWRDVFGSRFHNGRSASSVLPYRLKFLSTAVNEVLERWFCGEIALQLRFDKPTPQEVLEAQSRGQRIVSALISKDEILHFEEHGRDFISFLIHDLVHAHHFFTDEPGEFERQVLFAGWMKEVMNQGVWHRLIEARPQMKDQFEYLISDMNTHTWHLIKTLKSLLDQAQVPAIEKDFLSILGPELSGLWPQINSSLESLALTHQFLNHMSELSSATLLEN